MGAPTAFESGQRLVTDKPSAFVGPGASAFSCISPNMRETALQSDTRALLPTTCCGNDSRAIMPGGEEKRKKNPEEAVAPAESTTLDRHSSPIFSTVHRPRLSLHARRHSDSDVARQFLSLISQPKSFQSTKCDSEKPSLQPRRYSTSAHGLKDDLILNHECLRSDGDSELSKDEEVLKPSGRAARASRDFGLQFLADGEKSHRYHDTRQSNQESSPIPPSTRTLEKSPAKDSLGVDTWTGSQFSPKFVRAAEVPGLGLCYFYDDGSSCKAVINGEAVNPYLGVTKAGKPRKRLAMACMTCRDRKIKCNPDFPRCVQCEKHGRICKLNDASSEDHREKPATVLAEAHKGTKPGSGRQSVYPRPGSRSSSHSSPQTSLSDGQPRKRMKLDHRDFTTRRDPSPAESQPVENSKSPRKVTAALSSEIPLAPESFWNRALNTDPYAADPRWVSAVVTQFFAHVDNTMILQFLPEKPTTSWIVSLVWRKTSEDLMLVYSMLAVGVTLSRGPKHVAQQYAQMAHDTHRVTSRNCLQVAQGMILLAVYYNSASMWREVHESISTAAQVCATLQLNLELDKTREASATTFPLALSRAGYSEARRRTMWSLFMLERLDGWFLDRMTVVSAEDMYIRLPADLRAFESQVESDSPIFDPTDFQIFRAMDRPREVASYLVQMVHFWAESQSYAFKLVHRPAHPTLESSRNHTLLSAISQLRSALPKHLDSLETNLEDAAMAGQLGSFVTMHLLCNHALIKLERYRGTSRQASLEFRRDAVDKCRHHATQILQLIKNLHCLLRSRPVTLSGPLPMVAVAVDEAVDVLNSSRPVTPFEGVVDILRVKDPFMCTMSNVPEYVPKISRTNTT